MNCSNSFELTTNEKTETINQVQKFQEIGAVNIRKGTKNINSSLKTNIPNARSCIEIKYDRYDKKICSDDLIQDAIDHEFSEDVSGVSTCECVDNSFEFTNDKGCVPIESLNFEQEDENKKVQEHVDNVSSNLEKIELEYTESQKKVETLTLELNKAIQDFEKKKEAKVKASAASVAAQERLKLTELKAKQKFQMRTIILLVVISVIVVASLILYLHKTTRMKILNLLTNTKSKK